MLRLLPSLLLLAGLAVPAAAAAGTDAKHVHLTVRVHIELRGRPVDATMTVIRGGRPVVEAFRSASGASYRSIVNVAGGTPVSRFRTGADGRATYRWPDMGSYSLCAGVVDHGTRRTLCLGKRSARGTVPRRAPEGTRMISDDTFSFE